MREARNKQQSRGLLREVDKRLRRLFRTAPLGNQEDPLDELVFIQLSIRTPEATYFDIFDELRERVSGDWERLLTEPETDFLPVLARGGMARVKLDRLKSQISAIIEAFGSATLDPLRSLSTAEAEEFLTALPGVGPKAARCVLLYSLHRRVFPVDSHCRRVMVRLGLLPRTLDRKAAHNVAQDLVPPAIRFSLHVNLVHHGREICRPSNPRCSSCPIVELCPLGRKMIEDK
jgi:endonuclease III